MTPHGAVGPGLAGSSPVRSEAAGRATLADIDAQIDGWTAAAEAVAAGRRDLLALFDRVTPRHVVVTGCGSPYFLGATATTLWQRALGTRSVVSGFPASEVASDCSGLVPWPADSVLVAISRSGATTEVLEAIDQFRRHGGAAVVGIMCSSMSPLASAVDLAITFDAGFEASVAQTRSFTSMLVAVESIAALLAGESPPSTGELAACGVRALDEAHRTVEAITDLAGPDRVDFLGSGAHFGLAREAMLKMTEMALTHSSAYHFLEYRHGPKSMVDDTVLTVGLVGGSSPAIERGVLDEVAALGGAVVGIRPNGPLATLMPVVQLLAHRRAMLRGLDPDVPRHLSAVVHLDRALRAEQTDINTALQPRGNRP